MNDLPALPDANQLNELASVRMECGIALAKAGTPEALRGALSHFDEAIALRKSLPLAQNPWFRYGLAAGWINRGDALVRLGESQNLVDAVNSYTAAIEQLADLPGDEGGLFVKRLAIAWMNRGLALEQQKREPPGAEAIHCYKTAIALLDSPERPRDPKHPVILASAWINLGNALLHAGEGESAIQACAAAQSALSLLGGMESKDLLAAEAGLKARHILCQALTISLGGSLLEPSAKVDLMCKLTDTAEEALKLVLCWENAGVLYFRPLATQFFHLGVLVYEQHQPQFLGEFLLDHLDPQRAAVLPLVGDDWLAIAEESLSRVRRGIRNGDFGLLATPQGLRRLEILKELREVESRLLALGGPPRMDSSSP